jgi:hypothetical protein
VCHEPGRHPRHRRRRRALFAGSLRRGGHRLRRHRPHRLRPDRTDPRTGRPQPVRFSRRRARAPHRGAGRRAAPPVRHKPAGRDRPGRLGLRRARRPLRPRRGAARRQRAFVPVGVRLADRAAHTPDRGLRARRVGDACEGLLFRPVLVAPQPAGLPGTARQPPDAARPSRRSRFAHAHLINVAPGSELAAKHHLDSQLRRLADAPT